MFQSKGFTTLPIVQKLEIQVCNHFLQFEENTVLLATEYAITRCIETTHQRDFPINNPESLMESAICATLSWMLRFHYDGRVPEQSTDSSDMTIRCNILLILPTTLMERELIKQQPNRDTSPRCGE